MEHMIITMAYKTKGVQKMIEFKPVSCYKLYNKDFSFGVPQRIKRIVEAKSFELIEVYPKYCDGLNLRFSGTGLSENKHHLFFHYRPF